MNRLRYSLVILSTIFILGGCGTGGTSAQKPGVITLSDNNIPVAVVSLDTENVTTNKSVVFDASQSSDADGDSLSYEWKDESGKLLSTDQKVDRLFTEAGDYTMNLYVADDKGGVASDSITVKVTRHGSSSSGNQPPVALALPVSPTEISSGETVHFMDNGSYDPDGTIEKYEWRDMDGILMSSTKNFDRTLYYRPQHDFNNDGTTRYVKTLYVTDNSGNVSSFPVEIIVHKSASNTPPTVNLGPDLNLLIGTKHKIYANGEDDGNIDKYIWKSGSTELLNGDYPWFPFECKELGAYTLSVMAIDNGQLESAVDTITVYCTVTGVTGSGW